MTRLANRLGILAPTSPGLRRGDGLARLGAILSRRLNQVDSADYRAWCDRFVPHLFTTADGLMHADLDRLWADLRTRRGARENILGHRGASKTTRTRPLILRSSLEGWEPYILLVMDTFEQAAQQLENLKHELVDNKAIRAAYPDVAGEGPKWRDDFIVLRNGVRIDAIGTGQKVRGRTRLDRRPTLIVCDDLQNDEQVQSEAQRRKAWQWFVRALMRAGEEGVTNVVNLATTLHPDAIACRLETHGGWQTRRYPAIVRWPERMDLWEQWEQVYVDALNADREAEATAFYEAHRVDMEAGAELQWPARFPLLGLMQARTLGHAAFESEMQCNPIDPETCEFEASYFEGVMVDEWPPADAMDLRVVSIDPSKGKKTKQGDYIARVKLGRERTTGLLIVEARLYHGTARQIVDDGIDTWLEFKPDALGIESDVFQSLFLDVFELVCTERKITMAVTEMPTAGVSKPVRIRRLDPYFARRRFRFVDSPGTRMLLDQLRFFPAADHDDGPDALEQALRLAIMIDHAKAPDPPGAESEQ